MRTLMFFGRNLTLSAFLLVTLSHCASKHQPIEFAPYFPTRPENEFSTQLISEMSALEAEPHLDLFGKKRLYDLYQLEARSLKPGFPRYIWLAAESQKLEAEIKPLGKETQKLREETLRFRDPTLIPPPIRPPFEHTTLHRAYSEAARLWNRDQNELAAKKLSALVAGKDFLQVATEPERFRILNLQFRVAIDLADYPLAQRSYQAMRTQDNCAEETTEAAFLTALHLLATGEPKPALAIFRAQCDRDNSPAHRLQRSYWEARLVEASGGDAGPLYSAIAKSNLPSYYVYLAKRHEGGRVELIPAPGLERPYLTTEMSIPGDLEHLLSSAEGRLHANLHREASIYLVKAGQILRTQLGPQSLFPLLYVAHLLQAAGNHLEAMKLYSLITTTYEDDPRMATVMDQGFLTEMFPRPFAASVEWLAHEWNIDPDFTYAIMRQESAFNPGAISMAHARGLMQLMPALGKALSREWGYQSLYSDKMLFVAGENLKLASFHLYKLGTVAPHLVLTAAAYNAGLSRVYSWWRKYGSLPLDAFVEYIPIRETRNYVKLVLRNYIYYKALESRGDLASDTVPLQLPPFPVNPPVRVSQLRVPASSKHRSRVTSVAFRRRRKI